MRKFLFNPFRRRRADEDLDDELRFYVETLAEEKARAGMPPDEALRAARIQFGGVEQVKEQVRDARPGAWLASILRDVRYAARGLAHSPGFTAVIVVSLAIAIGANTALFSVLNAVMLRPLPVAHPEQLYALNNPLSPNSVKNIFSWPVFERARAVVGDNDIAAMSRDAEMRVFAEGDPEPETDNVQLVSGEFFPLTGLSPALGRFLAPEDNRQPTGQPIAVISHAFWQRRFAASRNVIGRHLTLNGARVTILGVAPAGFTGMWIESPTDIWVPLRMQQQVHYSQYFSAYNADFSRPWAEQEGVWWLNLVERGKAHQPALANLFRREVSQAAATYTGDPELRRQLMRQYLAFDPFAEGFSSLRARYATPLFALMAMVGLVLLTACANTANLLLARGSRRRSEFAVRLSLGAGRMRIIRQLLTENFLLAALAASSGLALARPASELLVRGALGAAGGPPPLSTGADLRVLAFTVSIAVLTTLLFGFGPAFRATRIDLDAALRAGARGVREGSRIALQKLLVVSQMALTLILVVGALWFAGSLRNLANVRLGFDKDRIVTAWINPQSAGIPDAQLQDLYRQLVAGAESVPGVRSASIAMCGIAVGCRNIADLRISGYDAKPGERVNAEENRVDPAYFNTVGMRLLEGRNFSDRDTRNSPLVAIVNEAFVRRYFPGGDAIGHRIGYTDTGAQIDTEIVGVVEDARVDSARESPPIMVFYPIRQGTVFGGSLEVRVTGDPAARIADIRQAIRRVSRDLPVRRISLLSDQVSGNLRQDRLMLGLASAFGLLALGLGCFGLYGVMSYAVARRQGELGIRLALGAPASLLFRMVFTESLSMIAAGLVLGLPILYAASRLIAGLLYGVHVDDPAWIALASGALTATAALTALFPALRAARISPVAALRYE